MTPNDDYKISRDLQRPLMEQNLFSSSSAPWQQQILRELLSKSNIRFKGKCLDAACGIGNNIRTILDYDLEVIGIDKSERALNFAKNRYRNEVVSFFPSEIENMNFADNSFDVVICTEALEHIVNIKNAIVELHRVLKADGILIISFQNYLNLSAIIKPIAEAITKQNWDAWATHSHEGGFERRLTYFMVKKILDDLGMKTEIVVGADYLNGWLNWVPGIRKNYDLLDKKPFLLLGKIPLIKLMGMDCFIMAIK